MTKKSKNDQNSSIISRIEFLENKINEIKALFEVVEKEHILKIIEKELKEKICNTPEIKSKITTYLEKIQLEMENKVEL